MEKPKHWHDLLDKPLRSLTKKEWESLPKWQQDDFLVGEGSIPPLVSEKQEKLAFYLQENLLLALKAKNQTRNFTCLPVPRKRESDNFDPVDLNFIVSFFVEGKKQVITCTISESLPCSAMVLSLVYLMTKPEQTLETLLDNHERCVNIKM